MAKPRISEKPRETKRIPMPHRWGGGTPEGIRAALIARAADKSTITLRKFSWED